MSDRRIPLSRVVFLGPTDIPGLDIMSNTVDVAVPKAGQTVVQPFYDPDLRVVVMGNRLFPVETVRWMERAKMAVSEPKPAAEVVEAVRAKLKRDAK